MPRLRSIGWAPKDNAICGRAVAITVPSRFSMKNAPATSSVTDMDLRLVCDSSTPRIDTLPKPSSFDRLRPFDGRQRLHQQGQQEAHRKQRRQYCEWPVIDMNAACAG